MRPSLISFAGASVTCILWASAGFCADAGTPRDAGSDLLGDASSRDATVNDAGHMSSDSGGMTSPDARVPDSGLAAPRFVVGKACAQTSDCAAGLSCVSSHSDALGSGAPPNGLCTVDCSAKGQPACDSVDTGSMCVVVDASKGTAYCYERCPEGTPTTDVPKCHDRADMACAPNQAGVGYCAPTCQGDADCGGRKCNPVSGLCVTSVVRGTAAIGATCDPASANTCEGACLTVGSGTPGPANSACTRVCSIGSPTACGRDPASAAPAAAGCVPLIEQNEGAGDIGACAQLCDCNSDCHNPDFVCQPVPASIGQGHQGGCAPKANGNGVIAQGLTCGTTSPPDAGSLKPGSDSGLPAGEAPDGGAASHKDSSGCGCRVGDTGSKNRGALAAYAALGLGILARRRRR